VSNRGFLDTIEGYALRGWAIDDASTEPALVDICIDGTVIATVSCSEFRADLADAFGDGRHAFSYSIPSEHARRPGLLSVRFAGGGPLLTNGEHHYQPDLAYSLMVSSVLARGAWDIRSISFTGDSVLIEGWGVPPAAFPFPVALTHNGETIADVTWHPSEETARMPGWGCYETGFSFRARQPSQRTATNHEFNFVHGRTKRPFDPNQSIHYIVSDHPLAPETLRLRVAGTREPASFVRLGSSTFARLQQVLEDYCSKAIDDFAQILDWGCGCGRTLRYFAGNLARAQLTGVDIDTRAIDWCRQAFPCREFLTISTQPPTPIPDETFDLIYGISVMTHLREADHLSWLRELSRLSKEGGIVLLTTLGETAFWRGRVPWNLFAPWHLEKAGFFDTGSNYDLGELKIDADYYRNVFISHGYIVRNWAQYFDVLDILPGAICNQQDLVILQKRAPAWGEAIRRGPSAIPGSQ
jgi:SAM-dependent methyltransferase